MKNVNIKANDSTGSPALAPVSGLGGVPRETVMLAAGFCYGLADSDRHHFDEHERKILIAAARALRAAGEKLTRN